MIVSSFDRVENIVEKGEISLDEQFLHFPQCFQKACFQGASKGVVVWEWVKLTQIGDIYRQQHKNIVKKGENACHILLCTVFLIKNLCNSLSLNPFPKDKF